MRTREEKQTYDRTYYAAHREEKLARNVTYRAAHLDELNAQRRGHRIAHLENMRARARAYYANHREGIKRQIRARAATRRARDKSIVLAHYGTKCVCCGFDQAGALVIDHVNGGGAKHRRERRTSNMWGWLIKHNFPEGFQLLCANCNMSKWAGERCTLNHKSTRPGNGGQIHIPMDDLSARRAQGDSLWQ